jgi:hypothetical protein
LIPVAKILTALAEAGEINAELNLAGIHSFDATGLSPKVPAISACQDPGQAPPNVREILAISGAPEDLAWAFKYT